MKALFAIVLTLLAATASAQDVTAVLEPAESVDLKPVLNGRLVEILVDEGQPVTKGWTLARLDDAQQRQRVDLAQVVVDADGQIKRAEAQLAQAKSLQARMQRARSRGAAQSWEVDQANQAVALAEAEVQISMDARTRAQAQLALEKALLEDFRLIAPFDGLVLQRQVDVGASIDPQSVVMTVGRIDALKATGFVPVEWLPKLQTNRQLAAQVIGLSRAEVSVDVMAIDPRIDPASRTVRITFSLPNEQREFLPGSTLFIPEP